MNSNPIILATIPTDSENDRLQLVMDQTAEGSVLRLQQQTYGPGIGWYTQQSVAINPDQLPALRQSLGASIPARKPRNANHLRVV